MKRLKAYTFNFKGISMGGEATIIARSYEDALAVCKKHQPYEDEPRCDEKSGTPLKEGLVVHCWNGDY